MTVTGFLVILSSSPPNKAMEDRASPGPPSAERTSEDGNTTWQKLSESFLTCRVCSLILAVARVIGRMFDNLGFMSLTTSRKVLVESVRNWKTSSTLQFLGCTRDGEGYLWVFIYYASECCLKRLGRRNVIKVTKETPEDLNLRKNQRLKPWLVSFKLLLFWLPKIECVLDFVFS